MSTPNVAHGSKFQIHFSNIPGYKPSNTNLDNMNIFDLYVKDVQFPGLTVEYTPTDFKNYHINHPISKINDDMRELTITLKLSEGMQNYYWFFNWMKGLREGKNLDNKEFFRENYISSTLLTFLDNEKRPKWKYNLTNCFLTDLSPISLEYGSDDEISFTISLIYEDFDFEPGSC